MSEWERRGRGECTATSWSTYDPSQEGDYTPSSFVANYRSGTATNDDLAGFSASPHRNKTLLEGFKKLLLDEDPEGGTTNKHARHTSDVAWDRVSLAIYGPLLSGQFPPPAEPYPFWVVNIDRRSKADKEEVGGALSKDGEDLEDRLPLSHFLRKSPQKPSDISSTIAANRKFLEADTRRRELAELEGLRVQLQREQERTPGLERQLSETQADMSSMDADATSEYRLLKRKLEIELNHVDNLRQRIFNKDDKIDRQEDEIEHIRYELLRYHKFEYVPNEMDNVRASLSRVQGIAADKTLLADNLESQCGKLRLQIRYLHVDRKRILKEKDTTEGSNQELIEKLRRFDQLARDRQKASWSDQKKYFPTNEFNEHIYHELTSKVSSLECSLVKYEETVKVVLPLLEGKVKSLEEETARLKARETQLLGKVATAEAASTQLTLQLAAEKEKFKTELVTKVKEGVKAVAEKKRADPAAKKESPRSIPPKE
ncbi:paramyosin-like [Papaver somniferum]|uniref:paramyosin-like n=1 Tax=Papaver somniferum TaxID=3469 RepID=UPI000E7048A2|nr:paramyosin-like [Papaver somniferum]